MTRLGLSGRPRLFYGWWIVATAMVAMALGSGITFLAFGLYVSPIEDEFGWSRAQISLGFSLAYLCGGVAAPVIGRVVDLKGPRASIGVGAVLASLSFALLAQTGSQWQWCVFVALNAVCFQMLFFIPFTALVSRWFVARRGAALSMVSVGFQVGGFVVVPLMQMVIDSLGWRGGFYFSAAIVALFFIPAALFVLRNGPADVGEEADGGRHARGDGRSEEHPGITPGAALRMPHFWLSALAFACLIYGFEGWMVHQVPFWESVGYSRETAALLVSLTSGVSIFVRLGFGLVADRVHRFELLGALFAGMLSLALLSISFETSALTIGLYLIFRIIGGTAMLFESLHLLKSYGVAYFASILGMLAVFETVSEMISPWLAGRIFDRTGDYNLALLMFAGAFLLASLLFGIASRLPRPLESVAVSRSAAASGRGADVAATPPPISQP